MKSYIQERGCIGHFNTWFYPKVKYVYMIDNEKIVSETMYLFTCTKYFNNMEDAEKIRKRIIKDNNTLTIYVNPKDKYESIVLRGKSKEFNLSYIPPIFAILAFMGELYIVLPSCT